MLIGEIIPELQERLAQLLQVLIQRCSHSHPKNDLKGTIYSGNGRQKNNLFNPTFFPFSSLVVDKQPPQVIKTQSKFSTTVRYLLGEKVAPGKPVVLKAHIINELQARNLGTVPG